MKAASHGEGFIAIVKSGGNGVEIGAIVESGFFDELLVVGVFRVFRSRYEVENTCRAKHGDI